MIRPATAGPTMRAALKAAELSATALTRSALPTISAMYDWRAGMSNACARPASTATTPTCQYRTRPDTTSAASTSASAARVSCVTKRTRRLGRRSAKAPVTIENSKIGPNCSVPMRPRRRGESVSCRTSQDCATVCIQPDTSAASCATKNRRKSPWLRARRPLGKIMGFAVE